MDFTRYRRVTSRACAMLTVLFSSSLLAGSSNAVTIDFEYLAHGEVANGTVDIVTISADNFHRSFDYAVGFNSHAQGTADPDLQASGGAMQWSGGNIAGQDLGILLILQENSAGCSTGTCSNPDDEGRRAAGVLRFDFSTPVLDFGFDAVDIESLGAENATIKFFGGGETATVHLMDFFDTISPLYDPTLVLGNNTANRFAAIPVEFLGLSQIEYVEFKLGGSGALDNLEITLIPEPTTALLMSLGLGAIVAKRRIIPSPQA